jgi:predicted nucleic acid-binding protein
MKIVNVNNKIVQNSSKISKKFEFYTASIVETLLGNAIFFIIVFNERG